MKTSHLVMAGLLAALLGLPSLATEHEPKSKPSAKSKAKAGKAKPQPKADAKAKADAAQTDRQKEDTDRLNERLRRAENDQKDRARGVGASSGATSSTPSSPSGVDTAR